MAPGPTSADLQRANIPRWLLLCAALPLASCERAGVYDPQGPVASAEWLLFVNATEIMLVVVVSVILATFGFAGWYRSSNAFASRQSDIAYEGGSSSSSGPSLPWW